MKTLMMNHRNKIKRSIQVTAMSVIALTTLIMIQACPSKNNNSPAATAYPGGMYPGGNNCLPGQICNSSTGYGIPLLNGPIGANIDSYGSFAQFTINAQQMVPGQNFGGPVIVTGIVQYNTPYNQAYGSPCPPGQYQFQGQMTFESGYGGTVGRLSGQAQIMGGYGGGIQAYLNGLIYAGQDNHQQMPSVYVFQGIFQTTCNPGGVAI